jgi:hypothetical protein
VFSSSGIDGLIPVFESIDDAVAGLNTPAVQRGVATATASEATTSA